MFFFCEDAIGKISSMVNGAKQYKKTVRLGFQESMEKKC